MLIFVTSGYITTATVLYIITGTLMTVKGICGSQLTVYAKTEKDVYYNLKYIEDKTPWITRSNIIMSSIVHLVLIYFLLGSSLAFAAVVLSATFRLIESFNMEKLFNGKINPLY